MVAQVSSGTHAMSIIGTEVPQSPPSRPGIGPVLSARSSRWILALIVVALASFPFIGARGIWEPDEGRYTAVALEMLRSRDWVHPALNHEQPHFTKPPITYWSIAGSVALLGRSEAAVRLPSALAFGLTAFAVGAIAARISRGRGIASTVIYATATLPFIAANLVTTDTLLTLFVTVAVLMFVRGWRRFDALPEAGCRRLALIGMWGSFGIAFLTKGPPALLMLLPIVAVVWRFDGPRHVARLFNPFGVLTFVMVGGSWFAFVVVKDPALATYFFQHELYGRAFTSEHHRNSEWYMAFMYPLIMLGGLLPWSLGWLSRRARGWHRGLWSDPARLLLALWVTLPLFVFMLVQSRMPLYVLPLAAPLAIASARLESLEWLTRPGSWRAILTFVLVLLSVRFGSGVITSSRDARALAERLAVSPDVDEIGFVDARARYGLTLYTGIPVEQLYLSESHLGETLEAELVSGPHRSLALVYRPELRGVILDIVRLGGWRVGRIDTHADEELAYITRSDAEGSIDSTPPIDAGRSDQSGAVPSIARLPS